MKTAAATAALAIIACCPCCFLISLGDLDRGSDPPTGADAFRDAPEREVSTGEQASDGAGALERSMDSDSSTEDDSKTVASDSSDRLASDATSGLEDASQDGAASVDSDADALGADAAESGQAPFCTGDLSNIGTADFRVAFSINTQTTRYSALLNQRSVCNAGSFWDVRINGSVAGSIYAEIDDGTRLINIAGSVPINDGSVHRVVFTRTAGTLIVELDGAVAGMTPGTLASTASFGALVPLRQGIDVCDGQDGTQPLVGIITNVCVSH